MHLHNLSTSGILKLFLTAAEKKFLCLGIRNCIILWYHDFLTSLKICIVKTKKCIVFPKLQYVNVNSNYDLAEGKTLHCLPILQN